MTDDKTLTKKKFEAILSMENQILFDDPDIGDALQRLKENEKDENSQEYIDAYIDFMKRTGLCAVYAYYCKRCNYIWLPRDFDPLTKHAFGGGKNIFYKKPPKCCARCKSKYWNKMPQRKTKHVLDPKQGIYSHDMLVKPRLQALQRNASRVRKIMSQKREHLEQGEKEFHRKMEQMGIKDKKPIEVIMPKKKKKNKVAVYA